LLAQVAREKPRVRRLKLIEPLETLLERSRLAEKHRLARVALKLPRGDRVAEQDAGRVAERVRRALGNGKNVVDCAFCKLPFSHVALTRHSNTCESNPNRRVIRYKKREKKL
jgi:hypothetical protein